MSRIEEKKEDKLNGDKVQWIIFYGSFFSLFVCCVSVSSFQFLSELYSCNEWTIVYCKAFHFLCCKKKGFESKKENEQKKYGDIKTGISELSFRSYSLHNIV